MPGATQLATISGLWLSQSTEGRGHSARVGSCTLRQNFLLRWGCSTAMGGATGHRWPLNTCNVATVAEEMSFNLILFYLT